MTEEQNPMSLINLSSSHSVFPNSILIPAIICFYAGGPTHAELCQQWDLDQNDMSGDPPRASPPEYDLSKMPPNPMVAKGWAARMNKEEAKDEERQSPSS